LVSINNNSVSGFNVTTGAITITSITTFTFASSTNATGTGGTASATSNVPILAPGDAGAVVGAQVVWWFFNTLNLTPYFNQQPQSGDPLASVFSTAGSGRSSHSATYPVTNTAALSNYSVTGNAAVGPGQFTGGQTFLFGPATPTPTLTATPSATPTLTATPSATPTLTATPSTTPTVSATLSATPSTTPTTTTSATPSPTPAPGSCAQSNRGGSYQCYGRPTIF
jgi:hypothetical protein